VPVLNAGVVPHVTTIGGWYGFFLTLALLSSSWILWASLVRAGDPPRIKLLGGERALRLARIVATSLGDRPWGRRWGGQRGPGVARDA